MKKIVKRLAALVLALALCLSVSLPAFAAEPRRPACPNCGSISGSYSETTSYGPWYNTGFTNCPHGHAYVTDSMEERLVYTTGKCTACRANETFQSGTDSRIRCNFGARAYTSHDAAGMEENLLKLERITAQWKAEAMRNWKNEFID